MTNPTIAVADALAALLADVPDAGTFADPDGGPLELEFPISGRARATLGFNPARGAVVLTLGLDAPASSEGLEDLSARAHQARWRDGPIPGLDDQGQPSLAHVLTGTPDARALDKLLRDGLETLEAACRGAPAAGVPMDAQTIWIRV